MVRTREFLRRLWDDETGATMVEYGLLVALIAVVVAVAAVTLGSNVSSKFNDAANCVGSPTVCPGAS